MATFNDLQNLLLWRLRQRGVNFGNAPGNGAGDAVPPYVAQQLLNLGYNEFAAKTMESGIMTLKVAFPTVLNATAYSLRPIPPNGATLNPAALRVLEGTYTTQAGGQNSGYEYEFELVSVTRFKQLSGDYTRRLSWQGPRTLYACQLYGRPQLDVLPGSPVTGDLIQLTVVPDPGNAPANLTAAAGGPLANPTDVPLFPSQFHQALVEYGVMNAGSAIDKALDTKRAEDRWQQYIADALEFGATYGSGDPETRVLDTWATPILRE